MTDEAAPKISNIDVTKEECEYLRQRYNVLKAVNERCQVDLRICKSKVKGVDTILLLLKESKQETANLFKLNNGLRAAVTNLQQRLLENGLPSSTSVEDTKLFIPGASKQTLDNLAKENVRLRTENEQSAKKNAQEMNELKAELEKLKSDNNVLRSEITNHHLKISALSDGKEKEKEEEYTDNDSNKQLETTKDSFLNVSIACQTSETSSNSIEDLSKLLKLTVQRCAQLDEQLHQSQAPNSSGGGKIVESTLKRPILVDEDYQKLKKDLEEALVMNQRWQMYSQSQESRIQSLQTNITEMKKLQDLNIHASNTQQEEMKRLQTELISKDAEIQELKRQVLGLSKEAQYSLDHIEILKQQIQVCTEDFDTERKDREKANSREKSLEDENKKLKAEIGRLKEVNNATLKSQYYQPRPAYQPNSPVSRHPFGMINEKGSSQPVMPSYQAEQSRSQSPISAPVQATAGVSAQSPPLPFSNQSHTRVDTNPMATSHAGNRNYGYHSLPRQPLPDPYASRFNVTDRGQNRGNAPNISMPVFNRRGSSSQEQILVCPNCNTAFPESSSAELLAHIDMCKTQMGE